MAQADAIEVQVRIDLAPARRAVRRVLTLAREANRELATLEAELALHADRLAALGIRLTIEED